MADEEKTEQKTDDEAPKKKSKLLLWIAIAVVVMGSGAAGFFILKGGGEAAPVEAADATAEAEPATLVAMDTFLVNLSDPSGERYLKLTMRLTISPEAAAEKVEGDDLTRARVRDRILTILMSKSFQELSNPLGKESLRLEIKAQIDSFLEEGSVQDVLFSEFVVQ